MKKKIIGILVCMLLITTALPVIGTMNEKESITSRYSLSSNIWIVDDEGDGNFTNIQDAIDNESVKNGDTIEVYSGNYSGNVVIHKELIIEGKNEEFGQGNGSGKPIVNDTSDINITFKITSNTVEISGFELVGGEIEINQQNNISISDNNFTNNNVDINLTKCEYNIFIINNYFVDIGFSSSRDVLLNSCSDVEIQYNIFEGSFRSVILRESSDNNVSNNDFFNNFFSISLMISELNTISENKIKNFFPSCDTGIFISTSRWNNIKDNYISGNERGLHAFSSHSNDIIGNYIMGNIQGLSFVSTIDNEVRNNDFENNFISIAINSGSGDNFKHNNLEDSTSGYELFASLSYFSASWNYWGDWKGPIGKVFPPWYIIFCIPWSLKPY